MKVLTNARLLPMDAAMRDIARGWIALDGTQIAALGEGDPPEDLAAATVEDMAGDLLMPGMVNPHCHLPMTLFRGLGEDVDDRLFRYILPLERALVDAEVVEIGTRLG
ncbi:MAG: amidohydrolase, partial [Pseudomonadota bacterium]